MASASSVSKLKSVVVLCLPFAVAACASTDRIKTTTIPMGDYNVRHPIVIAEAKTSIDIFPSMAEGRLDRHTAKQVFAFATQYRSTGHGPIFVLLPRGGAGTDTRRALSDIRRVLSAGGAREGVSVSSYPVADPRLASPIRLSYTGIKAEVGDQCGQWPNDVASGSSLDGWQNKPYWNFGCSNQSMMAAQASDPRDLVTPRGEEPADTQIRVRGIESIRKGADPNTGWQVKNTNLGGVGGG